MAVVNPWIWGLGRRKSAVARVRIKAGTGLFTVNGKEANVYFTTERDQRAVHAPFDVLEDAAAWDVHCNVDGGGPHGQAGAVSLGVARAFKEANPVLMEQLRELGLLTRDSRMKERKKYGRRGARRGFQFSKR